MSLYEGLKDIRRQKKIDPHVMSGFCSIYDASQYYLDCQMYTIKYILLWNDLWDQLVTIIMIY